MSDDATLDVEGFDALPPTEPDAGLGGLDRLIGTRQVTGGAEGTVSYEWMEGGFFLLQHVGGERGSPASYAGTFSDDGQAISGEWVHPGGGGYESTTTRIDRESER